jgi:ribosomal protein S18 acetylase RimI-like enzyme
MIVFAKEIKETEKVKYGLKLKSLFKRCVTVAEVPSFFNWSDENIEIELRSSRFFVLFDEAKEIQSFISFRENLDVVEIMALATDPEQKGRGYMTVLLRKFVELYSNKHKSIQLEVHDQNLLAIKLYTKCGFSVLRQRKNYYSDGGDAIVFAYFLLL